MKFRKIITIILVIFIGLLVGCTDSDFEYNGIICSVDNYFFKLNDYKLDCNDGECKIIIYAESKVPVINVEAKVNLYNSSDTIYATMNLSLDKKIKANKEFKIKGDISHSYCNKFKKLQVEFEGESYVNPYEYLNVCTVTFVYNNGQDDKTIFLEKGSRLSQPSTPIKENYIFEGWYIDKQYSQKYDFNRSVNQNIYIFAKFSIDYDKVNEKISNEIIKCCVKILQYAYKEWWNPFTKDSCGSGIIFDYKDGYYYILTNKHVAKVPDGYAGCDYSIVTSSGLSYDGQLVCVSEKYDLAIVKFRKLISTYNVIKMSKEEVKPGDDLVTVSCPDGKLNRTTFGKMEKLITNKKGDRDIDFNGTVYYHDVEIYPGSSGSGLLNMNLELVGINYAGNEESEYDLKNFTFGLAIPMNLIDDFLYKCYY